MVDQNDAPVLLGQRHLGDGEDAQPREDLVALRTVRICVRGVRVGERTERERYLVHGSEVACDA